MAEIIFEDRREAGERLATILDEYHFDNPLVMAIPRGGVVVAKEIADTLRAPLDVVVTRKLGLPQNPEFAFGAIAPAETRFIDRNTAGNYGLSDVEIEEVVATETTELKRRIEAYRIAKDYLSLVGRTVFVVDDGVATGFTAKAALAFVRKLNPDKLIFISPVCAKESLYMLKEADKVICLNKTENMLAVGQFYRYFPQLNDEEVLELLHKK